MPRSYGVIVLNKYPELANHFLESVRRFHTRLPEILVVADRHKETFGDDIHVLPTDDPFTYSKNANRGIRYFPGKDIILCNDDLSCVQGDFFDRLYSTALKYPQCGILSPLIDGGVGNPLQQYPANGYWQDVPADTIAIAGTSPDSMPVCFPCVYIRRRLIDEIGMLDETFMGYGEDDSDYCIRARKADYWTMITRTLHIKHGSGGNVLSRGKNWSVSFAREPQRNSNMELLIKKHESKSYSSGK